jgi:hypothetical protein
MYAIGLGRFAPMGSGGTCGVVGAAAPAAEEDADAASRLATF